MPLLPPKSSQTLVTLQQTDISLAMCILTILCILDSLLKGAPATSLFSLLPINALADTFLVPLLCSLWPVYHRVPWSSHRKCHIAGQGVISPLLLLTLCSLPGIPAADGLGACNISKLSFWSDWRKAPKHWDFSWDGNPASKHFFLFNINTSFPLAGTEGGEEYSPFAPFSRDLLGAPQVALVPYFNEPVFHWSQMSSWTIDLNGILCCQNNRQRLLLILYCAHR